MVNKNKDDKIEDKCRNENRSETGYKVPFIEVAGAGCVSTLMSIFNVIYPLSFVALLALIGYISIQCIKGPDEQERQRREYRHSLMEKVTEIADTDKNGRVSKEEWTQVYKVTGIPINSDYRGFPSPHGLSNSQLEKYLTEQGIKIKQECLENNSL